MHEAYGSPMYVSGDLAANKLAANKLPQSHQGISKMFWTARAPAGGNLSQPQKETVLTIIHNRVPLSYVLDGNSPWPVKSKSNWFGSTVLEPLPPPFARSSLEMPNVFCSLLHAPWYMWIWSISRSDAPSSRPNLSFPSAV